MCLTALLGLIAFMSTSIAGDTCDRTFHSVMAFFFKGRSRGPVFGMLHFVAEKGLHFCLFLALALLLWQVLPPARWRVPFILAVALFAGASSEWLQNFFPRRDPTLRDVAIDFSGAVCGLLLRYILDRRTGRPGAHRQPAGVARTNAEVSKL